MISKVMFKMFAQLLLQQPNQQHKTKQLGWCGIIIGKNPPHHKLIFGIQPFSNPTRRNMEDDLNIFENERRP